MYSRKMALSFAKQYRTCPPGMIRRHPSHEKAFQEHLTRCPYCSSVLGQDSEEWDALAIGLSMFYPQSIEKVSGKAVVEPGMLCPVQPEMGGWHDGNYYNPPLILILSLPAVISDEVLVAQTYNDTYLAAPGDLILTDEQTGCGELFVECWHTYTLRASHLCPPVGNVPGDILKAVRNLSLNEKDYPLWAPLPKPMDEQDSRIYFRQLEVEVGYWFASQAVSTLMKILENSDGKQMFGTVEEIQVAMKKKQPEITWSRTPKSPAEALATFELPAEHYQMAAASEEQIFFQTRLAVFKGDILQELTVLPGKINMVQSVSGSRSFSGIIQNIPHERGKSQLICFLMMEDDSDLIQAREEDVSWDPDQGFFYAEFLLTAEAPAQLFVAITFND